MALYAPCAHYRPHERVTGSLHVALRERSAVFAALWAAKCKKIRPPELFGTEACVGYVKSTEFDAPLSIGVFYTERIRRNSRWIFCRASRQFW